MKKLSLLLIKNLLAVLACITLISCGETLLDIPENTISRVSTFEKEPLKMAFTYDDSKLYGFNTFKNGVHVPPFSLVGYNHAGSINCTIDGTRYDVELANGVGGYRAVTVTASIGGALKHKVTYKYDNEGRISQARIDGIRATRPDYVEFTYEANAIKIWDVDVAYRIELSSTEINTGNVCNVLDYAGAPYTSTYVVPNELYFLNVFGVSFNKLPQLPQDEIERDDSQRLTRVGQCYYEY